MEQKTPIAIDEENSNHCTALPWNEIKNTSAHICELFNDANCSHSNGPRLEVWIRNIQPTHQGILDRVATNRLFS